MEDALKVLAEMKSAGASVEDREAKLVSTEAQLRMLLSNRASATREGTMNRPVRKPLANIYPCKSEQKQVVGITNVLKYAFAFVSKLQCNYWTSSWVFWWISNYYVSFAFSGKSFSRGADARQSGHGRGLNQRTKKGLNHDQTL